MRKVVVLGLVAVFGLLSISTVALAGRGKGKGNGNATNFATRLNGWEEDPSQVTTGKGSFRLEATGTTAWRFTLRYQDLEGPVAQAHIHIGSRHESGGISAWLCGPSADTEKACPPGPDGELTSTITAADITGPLGQGVEPGNFADLLRALRKGETYTNVHTSPRAPGGEIRGQNHPTKDHDDDD
jgi:CHRD domain